jgi:dTDP-4-dehydrorhamnose 3,5-epimerase
VLEENTIFSYKCDNFYSAQADRGLMYNDPSIGIRWPEIAGGYLLSEKDKRHPFLDGIEQNF